MVSGHRLHSHLDAPRRTGGRPDRSGPRRDSGTACARAACAPSMIAKVELPEMLIFSKRVHLNGDAKRHGRAPKRGSGLCHPCQMLATCRGKRPGTMKIASMRISSPALLVARQQAARPQRPRGEAARRRATCAAASSRRPRLDLDEASDPAAPGDDVDFAAGHAGAAGEDAPAVEAQATSRRASRRRGRAFRLPPGSFRALERARVGALSRDVRALGDFGGGARRRQVAPALRRARHRVRRRWPSARSAGGPTTMTISPLGGMLGVAARQARPSVPVTHSS